MPIFANNFIVKFICSWKCDDLLPVKILICDQNMYEKIKTKNTENLWKNVLFRRVLSFTDHVRTTISEVLVVFIWVLVLWLFLNKSKLTIFPTVCSL